jgi:hypothetical protein
MLSLVSQPLIGRLSNNRYIFQGKVAIILIRLSCCLLGRNYRRDGRETLKPMVPPLTDFLVGLQRRERAAQRAAGRADQGARGDAPEA